VPVELTDGAGPENPLAKPGAAQPAPQPLTVEERDAQTRAAIIVWANDLLTTLNPLCHYSEAGDRLSMYGMDPGDPRRYPITSDCSSSTAGLYKWAGADVAMLGPSPYTGSIVEAWTLIPEAQAKPADVVIFGPGTGQHAAVLLKPQGSDWLTFNNGGPTGAPPSRVLLSETASILASMGFPGVRYYRSLL